MRGTVSLYHGEQLLQTHTFRCKSDLDKAVEKWKKLYGPGYRKTTLEIDVEKQIDNTRRTKPGIAPHAKFVKRRPGMGYFDNKH